MSSFEAAEWGSFQPLDDQLIELALEVATINQDDDLSQEFSAYKDLIYTQFMDLIQKRAAMTNP